MRCMRLIAWLLMTSVAMIGLSSTRSAAALPPANIAGTYSLDVQTDGLDCRWRGNVALEQNGSNFDGTAKITLVEGSSPPCIDTLEGDVSGQVNGNTIMFGAAFAGIGMAQFEGEVSPDGQELSGTWTSELLDGTWVATRIVAQGAPAVGTLGLAALIFVLAWAGARSIGRRALARAS